MLYRPLTLFPPFVWFSAAICFSLPDAAVLMMLGWNNSNLRAPQVVTPTQASTSEERRDETALHSQHHSSSSSQWLGGGYSKWQGAEEGITGGARLLSPTRAAVRDTLPCKRFSNRLGPRYGSDGDNDRQKGTAHHGCGARPTKPLPIA